jgi:hypothetical protein
VQESWFEAQEGKDLRADVGLHRPLGPILEIRFQIEVDEAVTQWPWHREVHPALRRWIPGCDHHPPAGQGVLAQLSIEHQLIATSLSHLRRGCEFVEKQDSVAARRQKLGRHPLGAVRSDPRQATEVNRIQLDGADVEKLPVEIIGYLGNDL